MLLATASSVGSEHRETVLKVVVTQLWSMHRHDAGCRSMLVALLDYTSHPTVSCCDQCVGAPCHAIARHHRAYVCFPLVRSHGWRKADGSRRAVQGGAVGQGRAMDR